MRKYCFHLCKYFRAYIRERILFAFHATAQTRCLGAGWGNLWTNIRARSSSSSWNRSCSWAGNLNGFRNCDGVRMILGNEYKWHTATAEVGLVSTWRRRIGTDVGTKSSRGRVNSGTNVVRRRTGETGGKRESDNDSRKQHFLSWRGRQLLVWSIREIWTAFIYVFGSVSGP